MKIFILFFSLLIGELAYANTYYISPFGSDVTGTGSITNPWKTLYKATSSVSTPGDKIYVNPGTYTESQQSNLAPGVSIEGAGNTSIIVSTVSAVFTPALALVSTVEGTNGNQSISYIKMDGNNFTTSWGISVIARSNVIIHHCEFINFSETAVNFSGITAPTGAAAPAVYATGNSFHDNTVYNCSSNTVLFGTKYGKGNLQFGGQQGFTCYNNDIQQPQRASSINDDIGWPIKMANEGHIKGCKVYNNILKRAPIAAVHGQNENWNFSFEMWNIEGGLEFYNNTLQGEVDIVNCTKGIPADGYTYGMKFYNNTSSLPSISIFLAFALRLETNESDIEIYNNTVNNLNAGIVFSPHDYNNNGFGIDVHRINIHNNLFYNMGRIGGGDGVIMMDNESVAPQCYFDDFYCDNNTIIALAGATAPFFGVQVPAYNGGNTRRIYVRNNHIQGFMANPVVVGNGNNVSEVFIQNNNFYNNVSNTVLINNGGIPVNYTNSGNTTSAPNLNASYQPNTGSLLIDAGMNVGMSYNGSAPDMGYFEVGNSNIPPTANAGADQTITLPTNSVSLSGSGTDPDGTVTAYLWTKISGPAAGTITNAVTAATTVTGLVQGVYKFELKVTDNNGASARDTMQVTVNPDPNIAPTANAGADQTITLPTNSVTLSGSGTDPDGTVTAYQWTKISGPAAGTITSATTAATTVTGLVQGVYKFELKVTDNSGASGRDTMQVTVNPAPNVPPTANAGADQTITLPTNSVSLSGIGTDPDGTVTAYLWTKISGPATGTITNAAAAGTTVTGLTQGVYQFELKVTDNSGASARDTMQVTVNPDPNIAPTANAGPDQTITLPTNSVSLSGTGTDPDGTITAYQWTKISGPAAGAITNATTAATTVTGLVQGVYKFELRVTDNNGAFGRDTIQVTVNPDPNIAPTANAGADQTITLPTNSVTLSGSGTDPDGTVTAYQWTKISGPAAGTITSATTPATTVTGLVQGVYKFELRVTDNNGAFGRDTMQVTVNPAPNVPPTANAGADQTITLPTNSVTLSGSGTDPDGTVTAYQWTKISGPAAGTITNATTAATSVTGLVQGVYKFELRVTDNNGAFGRDTMQVTVNPDPNIAPTANAGPDQTITLPTNSVSLSGTGTDPDGTVTAYLWTKISGPAAGAITNATTAATTVTGLVQGVYKFELKVTDNSGASGRDTMQVTVNPALNVPPTANAGPDQTITLPTNTVSLIGTGTDPDGTVTAYQWTKISGPAAATITSASAANTMVTGLVLGVYKFELRVTDNNGAFGYDTMQVTVNPVPNVPPTANAGTNQVITLPVNTVTLSGSGTDPDGTIAAYQWTKISGPATGTITTAASATTTVTGLTAGVYQFTLKVTDNSGATASDTMQVLVNIPPTANAGPDQSITLPVSTATVSGSGTDADGTIASYAWTKIAGPAAGTITNPAAATTTITGLIGGVYKYELKVTDNNGATARDTMQLVVFAQNIPPTANAGLNQSLTLPTDMATLTGSGTDPDGTIVAYLWSKLSGPSAGTITNTSNAVTTVTGLSAGVYYFVLRVTDNSGAFGRDTVQVVVNAANIPPTANAGPDQVITLPSNKVTLTGSGKDVDGTVVGYAWKQISGPTDKLTSLYTPVTVLDGLIAGNYKLELTVTDNKGATGKDTVAVVVQPLKVNTQPNTIKVYPNPIVDITTLEINRDNGTSAMLVVVTDMQGKIVYQQKTLPTAVITRQTLDFTRLSKGIYMVTVYFSATEKQTIKAFKQ